MKKITLKSLELKNFKGKKSYVLKPNKDTTSIFGTNESGKSTLMNAYIWLILGKDKEDRKDYQIKTLDANNEPIHKIDHEVCALFDIDGAKVKLQRIYREKWTKKHGEEKPVMTGHTTEFLWNDVPKTQSEFTSKLNEIIADEILFKMLSNPLFFNDKVLMPWEKRREVLISAIGGEKSDLEILKDNQQFSGLFSKLTNKSMDEYKSELKNKKKLLNEMLDKIPTRIDELRLNTPEVPKEGYDAIEKEITKLKAEIDVIDGKINDRTKLTEEFYQRKSDRIKEIGGLKLKASTIEQSAREVVEDLSSNHNKKARDFEIQIQNIEKSITTDEEMLVRFNAKIKLLEAELPPLREDLKRLDELQFIFDEKLSECPTCKRKFDDDDILAKETEFRNNFNSDKAEKIEAIQNKGIEKKKEIDLLKSDVESLTGQIELAKERLNEVRKEAIAHKNSAAITTMESIVNKDKEYLKLKEDIKNLEFENNRAEPTVNVSDLKEQKQVILDQIKPLNDKLATKTQIEKAAVRETELEAEEKQLAQKISDLEKDEFAIEEFTKVKINMIEKPINDLFKTVKFKLFEVQINEGIKPCCECLIKGVPFLAANSADQIKSGIEIINVLNNHFQLSMPIWIDNSEMIVTPMPETSNQVIKMYASEKDLTLRVE
jgi:chromosome segregation ATPase